MSQKAHENEKEPYKNWGVPKLSSGNYFGCDNATIQHISTNCDLPLSFDHSCEHSEICIALPGSSVQIPTVFLSP